MKNGKTVIITGSAKGLGSNIALLLAKEGHNIIINYFQSKNEAKLLGERLAKITSVKIIKGDVSKFQDTQTIIQKTIKEFGSVDILINNAGIHVDELVNKMNPNNWKNVIDVNLTGTFNCSKSVLPQMIKQNYGSIINISSFTAFQGIAGASNYAASKAGVVAFTKSLAKEVSKFDITVNAIAPGYFDIGMFYDIDKKTQRKIISNIPAKRLGQPKEIFELIKIIISSRYTTGQVFTLDGGFSL
jgi:NAD(P)-dependent dehydrogenase (short-subunit alcohol dehydrogenase family)